MEIRFHSEGSLEELSGADRCQMSFLVNRCLRPLTMMRKVRSEELTVGRFARIDGNAIQRKPHHGDASGQPRATVGLSAEFLNTGAARLWILALGEVTKGQRPKLKGEKLKSTITARIVHPSIPANENPTWPSSLKCQWGIYGVSSMRTLRCWPYIVSTVFC